MRNSEMVHAISTRRAKPAAREKAGNKTSMKQKTSHGENDDGN
jgi:hypothetical protein